MMFINNNRLMMFINNNRLMMFINNNRLMMFINNNRLMMFINNNRLMMFIKLMFCASQYSGFRTTSLAVSCGGIFERYVFFNQ